MAFCLIICPANSLAYLTADQHVSFYILHPYHFCKRLLCLKKQSSQVNGFTKTDERKTLPWTKLMDIVTGAKIAYDTMGDIGRNVEELECRIAVACENAHRSRAEVTVIAVTKTVSADLVRKAFDAGIRHFGENKVQEAQDKITAVLPLLKPVPVWHMIGHLQTNKVKTTVGIFDIIHSIDSISLAENVNERVHRTGFPILLEVNVSGEASKDGFPVGEVSAAVQKISLLGNLEVKGLMTIAPMVNDPEEVRPIFRELRQLRDYLELEHLSMGMTDDFETAIEEGATMVRIGRAIFGERRY